MRLGERATPGDGVAAGAGEVDGRPVFCYAQDPAFLGGSLGEVHADTIVRTMRMAGDAGAPVVGFVRSGGARLQEGHAALAGYGRIFRASVELSRKVPQISILSGISAGGGAYSPALTDFVVMTKDSRMFLTGPKVVAEAMGEEISMEELGGPKVHGKNGVAHLIAEDAADAVAADPPPAQPAAAEDRRQLAPAPGHRPRRDRPRLGRAARTAQGLRRPRRRQRGARRRQPAGDLGRSGRRTWSPPSPASRAARSA